MVSITLRVLSKPDPSKLPFIYRRLGKGKGFLEEKYMTNRDNKKRDSFFVRRDICVENHDMCRDSRCLSRVVTFLLFRLTMARHIDVTLTWPITQLFIVFQLFIAGACFSSAVAARSLLSFSEVGLRRAHVLSC